MKVVVVVVLLRVPIGAPLLLRMPARRTRTLQLPESRKAQLRCLVVEIELTTTSKRKVRGGEGEAGKEAGIRESGGKKGVLENLWAEEQGAPTHDGVAFAAHAVDGGGDSGGVEGDGFDFVLDLRVHVLEAQQNFHQQARHALVKGRRGPGLRTAFPPLSGRRDD